MTNKNYLGNGTTVGKFLLIMIAGRVILMAAAYGINLPVSDVELAGYIGILLGFIYSVLDSYFKNNYKWNTVTKILNKIWNAETNDEKIITDIDPASEYENLNEDYNILGDADDQWATVNLFSWRGISNTLKENSGTGNESSIQGRND